MNIVDRLRHNIRLLTEAQDMTIIELNSAVNVNGIMYRKTENGCTIGSLAKIAFELNVAPEDLIRDLDEVDLQELLEGGY